MLVREIEVKSALHYHKNGKAADYDLNIYRGCTHNCKYCYAQYSHNYLNSDGLFFKDIFVKTNIADVLDKELNKKSWKGDLINIAGVCDCYQPIEEKYELMKRVLKVLIKYNQKVLILTKSPLILRDYNLIDELSKKAFVNIAMTVTTLDENIRKKIEPNTYPSLERIKALEKFTKLNCKTTLMLMPIIPYLNDDIQNIENIYKIVSKSNINNIIAAPLNLIGFLKNNFFNFLKIEFPNTYKNIQHLYNNSPYINSNYQNKLNKFINNMEDKYNFYSWKSLYDYEKSYNDLFSF